jgi:hypothetical protein
MAGSASISGHWQMNTRATKRFRKQSWQSRDCSMLSVALLLSAENMVSVGLARDGNPGTETEVTAF